MTKLGNTKLVQYGIYEEVVDLRIHVGFLVGEVFIYEREKMLVGLDKYRVVSAYQSGIETARGHLVPVDGIVSVPIPPDILENNKCNEKTDEGTKGANALAVVQEMLQSRVIQHAMPEYFKVSAEPVKDLKLQIEGRDIVLIENFPSMQVKCDYRAGSRSKGGTGNVFVQTHECNPFGKH